MPVFLYMPLSLEITLGVVFLGLLHWMLIWTEPRRFRSDMDREYERHALQDTFILFYTWFALFAYVIKLPEKFGEMPRDRVLSTFFLTFFIVDYQLRRKFKFLK